MKKAVTLLMMLVIFIKSNDAQVNTSNNKEYFDFLYRYNFNQQNLSSTDPRYYGNSISWDMQQLLNLYETTHDKAYLVQFVHLSSIAILNRFDVQNSFASQWHPMWTLIGDPGGESTYFNMLLTVPMAKFVYLIKNDNTLLNVIIPFNLQKGDLIFDNFQKLLTKGYTSIHSLSTYGDYADWLGFRVEETMNYLYTNYWDDSYGFKKFQTDNVPAEINMQSLMGCLFLYMYKVNHAFGPMALSHSFLQSKVQILANLYLGDFYNLDHCDIFNWEAYVIDNVFMSGNNNSFVWNHFGWKKLTCPMSSVLKEDVSHGAMDLLFPIVDYELGQEFFTNTTFFNKLHNTFTENIWVSPYKFYNSVYGTDNGIDPGQSATNVCNNANYAGNWALNYFWQEILDWMPLYQFDNGSNQVYDDLMLHAYNLKNQNFTSCTDCNCRNVSYLGGQGLLGLSEVIKAQWDKECVNLSLYNRDVVYDQDFTVKNNLTIEPQSSSSLNTTQSFADPIISTPDFIIESGVTSKFTSGEVITLKPGFHAKAGSTVDMKINISACTDGHRVANHSAPNPVYSHNQLQNANNLVSFKPNKTFSGSQMNNDIQTTLLLNGEMKLFPNPFTQSSTLQINLTQATNASILMYNTMGQMVQIIQAMQPIEAGNRQYSINRNNLTAGVYLLEIKTDNETVHKQMVIQ